MERTYGKRDYGAGENESERGEKECSSWVGSSSCLHQGTIHNKESAWIFQPESSSPAHPRPSWQHAEQQQNCPNEPSQSTEHEDNAMAFVESLCLEVVSSTAITE